MAPLALALIGYGKMGQAIEVLVKKSPQEFTIANIYKGRSEKDLAHFMDSADVVIDFTNSSLTDAVIDAASQLKNPLLIGTTGISDQTYEYAKKASSLIPICIAPNTSLAMTILGAITQKVSALLGPDYDIEITETHHRDKVDAPSGSTLMLGKAAALGRSSQSLDSSSKNPSFDVTYPHTQKRKPGSIGFAVSRGGGVFGEHSVRFLGDFDTLEFSHRALSRDLFAKGALVLAKALSQKNPGFYTPADLLGLSF